jgi:hypothetical protein
MRQVRRTLIVTEKIFQARRIAPLWQELHPEDSISHFYTPPMGSFRFHLPRELPLSSVPIIADPVLQRRPEGDLSPEGTSIFDGDFGAMAREADHIVCATDFDPAGCRNFLDLIDVYNVSTPLSDMTWLALRCLEAKEIKACIARDRRVDDPDFAKMAGIGRARQYFNNLYLLNSLPVFGRTLAMAGIDTAGDLGFMPKYSLQMLLLLKRLEPGPLTENDLLRLQVENPVSGTKSPMGSPISRFEIFSWLLRSGCLNALERSEKQKRQKYSLSDRGRRLASLIHKDCFDPYLGSRIHRWGETWPESKPAIDRYIRTFFGKQKRFLYTKSSS